MSKLVVLMTTCVWLLAGGVFAAEEGKKDSVSDGTMKSQAFNVLNHVEVAGAQPLFFIMKDVHTLNHEPQRAARWVELAHEEIERRGSI